MDYKNERERDEHLKKQEVTVKKIEKGLADNIYAKEKEKEVIAVPKTFKDKWSNFWYHNKGVFITICAAVLILSYFIYEFVTVPKYDATIILASDGTLTIYQDLFEKNFSQYVQDLNKDGKKNVCVSIVTLRPETSPQSKNEYIYANKMKLTSLIAGGQNAIFILDDVGYSHLANIDKEIFADLEKLYPGDKRKNIKKDRYYIKGTKIEKYLKDNGMDVSELPDSISICLRDISHMDKSMQQTFKKVYDDQKVILDAIIKAK